MEYIWWTIKVVFMIQIYKTFEINDNLWKQIVDGFNESFEGYHVTADSLKNGLCTSNQLGYGYHAIDFDNETGEVRGFNTYSPTFYSNGIKALVSGSTFVRKKFRKDIFIFGDLIHALRNKGREDGYHIEIGVPNQNSKEYAFKFLKTKYVSDLNYYILPRSLSACTNKYKFSVFDPLLKFNVDLFLLLHLFLSKFFNSKEINAKYSLIVDDSFYKARFKSSNYQRFKDGDFTAYYCKVMEGNVLVAYLMDFREKQIRTKRALVKAVRYIVKYEKPDAVLFIGFLRLKQHVLIKVPKKLVPKPLPLTYFVLDKNNKAVFNDLDDPNNWNFGLMNFDVR